MRLLSEPEIAIGGYCGVWRNVVKAYTRIAPSFDHVSSLRRGLRDERRKSKLVRPVIDHYILRAYGGIYWAPRYLVNDLFRAICESPNDIQASVVKVNPTPAPAKQRVLIEIKGHWAVGYEPMSTHEFQPLPAIAA